MADNEEDTAPNETAAAKNTGAAPATRPSDGTLKVARADARKRAEDLNKPVARSAKEGVGGESFAYLENVSVLSGDAEPSEETLDAAREDSKQRSKDLNTPIAREAKPKVGGESFAYLKNVGKA